jgi:hypothetical protein
MGSDSRLWPEKKIRAEVRLAMGVGLGAGGGGGTGVGAGGGVGGGTGAGIGLGMGAGAGAVVVGAAGVCAAVESGAVDSDEDVPTLSGLFVCDIERKPPEQLLKNKIETFSAKSESILRRRFTRIPLIHLGLTHLY